MDVVLVMRRILSEGRLSAKVKYDVNNRFSIKADAQVCFLIRSYFLFHYKSSRTPYKIL